jgi:hypothetical protein
MSEENVEIVKRWIALSDREALDRAQEAANDRSDG